VSTGISRRVVVTLKKASADPGVRLICFPYAGGNVEYLWNWRNDLADGIELVGVRLPGRGPRLTDPPYAGWPELLADTGEALAPLLAQPHAFYGHCFGGRLAYEMTRLASAEFPGRTLRLFLTACRSPAAPQAEPYLHVLADDEFRQALRKLGNAPAEVLDNDAMMAWLLPAVRNETRLAELWDGRGDPALAVPITAVYGLDDRAEGRTSMQGWREMTTAGCELVGLPGAHFFPLSSREELLGVINARLGAVDAAAG